MGSSKSKNSIVILPLAKDSILLPGTTLQIRINDRQDIPALLSSIYAKASTPQPELTNVPIGCVPLNSPFLSPDGQNLLDSSEGKSRGHQERFDINPSKADKDDLFACGTVARITGAQGRRLGDLTLFVEGMRRFTVNKFTQEKPFFEAEVTYHNDEIDSTDADLRSLFEQLKQLSRTLFALMHLASMLPQATNLSNLVGRRMDIFISRKEVNEAGAVADFVANFVDGSFEEKLRILSALNVKVRLERVNELLSRHVQGLVAKLRISNITTKGVSIIPIQSPNAHNLPGQHRDALLRRAMGSFGSDSIGPGFTDKRDNDGGGEDEPNELEELKKKLDEAQLTPEAQKIADRELGRLKKMNPAQAEYSVCRSYLENLSEIPWTKVTENQLNADTLKRARKQLDDDHYGLEKIKKRLVEYLAVLKLKQDVSADLKAQLSKAKKEIIQARGKGEIIQKVDIDGSPFGKKDSATEIAKRQVLGSKRMIDKSPILLLVGPPGTGKTSLAKSIAASLGRKFHRISLGGVRDEAEIRGHRRTYVAAMPGLIVNGLKKVGVANPVFLLDEIDKVGGSNFHGDPSAAMLEVLDPEQNHTFTDHYVNIPIDLSKVLFIATANTLDTIPPPLLDRMETISLSGYTTVEKRHIANQHLIPKQISTNGLDDHQVELGDEVVDAIITSYTRESGVRNLEREIGSVCRFKAVQYVDAKDSSKLEAYNPHVSVDDLEDILGIERFDEEIAEKKSMPGVVTGLVAYSSGGQGSILFIEVADMPGNGRVHLTGKLGDVLKESVEVALTWVKAHSFELGLTHDSSDDIMKNRTIHVHCPSGAIPKDGPSAGLAHTIALVSLFSHRAVRPELAMTGEVSLRGRVMPVGGIKEKLIGALRAGVKTVLLPANNRKDVKDLPQEVKDGLEIIHVEHIWEAMRHVWPDGHWPGEQQWIGIESRL